MIWLALAAMTAAAVLFVVLPLYRRQQAPAHRADYDIAVYKDQLGELERDAARGVIDADALRTARLEIERRLLAAAAEEERAGAAAASRGTALRWTAAVALIAVPAAALIYLQYGAPGYPDQPLAARQEAPPPDIAALIGQVERRLSENPDDLRGWTLLARAYARLGRLDDAIGAQARALALLDAEPDAAADAAELAAGFGEVLVQQAEGMVTPPARDAFRAALKRDDRNARARYYMALAKMQDGDPKAAVAEWKALIADAPENAPWLEALKRQIEEIEALRRQDAR